MIEEAITNASENRFRSVPRKITREQTGLKGALFMHVDFDRGDYPVSVSFSSKWKDGGTLDRTLSAIEDALNDILREGLR